MPFFKKIESYSRGIFFSTFFNVIAKSIGFINSIFIAFFFGTQAQTDVYFYAIAAVWLVASFFVGFSTSVLIPESIRLREQRSARESQAFLNFFLYFFAITAAAITAMFYSAPVRIFTLCSSFDSTVLLANKQMLLVSIPLIALMMLSTYLLDILTSYKYFTQPMIASMINSLFSIVFMLLFHGRLHVLSIMYGILAGYALNVGLLLALLKSRLAWNFTPRFVRLPRKVVADILFSQAGNFTSFLAYYFPLYLLSGLGAGTIAALNFGKQISEMPNQFISTQFSSVAGVKYAELYARDDFCGLDATLSRTVNFLVFILVPVTCLAILFDREIVTVLFKRGRFDDASVAASSMFLRYCILSLPFIGIDTIIARCIMACRKIKQAFAYQIALNAVFLAALPFLIRAFGGVGYPLAVLLKFGAGFFLMHVLLKMFIPFVRYGSILRYFFKILILNALIGAAVAAVSRYALPMHYLLRAGAGTALYTVLLLAANDILHVNDDARSAVRRFCR